jgi:hypothetical protein
MAESKDWQRNRSMWVRVLEKKTGQSLEVWNRRIRREGFADERSLKVWLGRQGIDGYAETLLIMERFGYPDFLRASARELIDAQYEACPKLRPIFDAIIDAADTLGPVVVQARKTYVSLVTPRRTFARVQAVSGTRVDLGLRLEGETPGGRLLPSTIHETMTLKLILTAPQDLDTEARDWMRKAYARNSGHDA